MSREENIALVQRYFDTLNSGHLEDLAQFMAAGYLHHIANLPPGLKMAKLMLSMYRAAFPDLQATLFEMLADGDKVVVRSTSQGTQTGEFMGHPASNRRFSAGGIDIFRIVDGQIVEHWGEFDTLSMLQQLGLR